VFLVSQGASKSLYYVGALLLLFVPGLHLRRGGAAWLLQLFHVPNTHHDYFALLAAVCVAAAVSTVLFDPCARGVVRLQNRYGYRRCSLAVLLGMPVLVLALTGRAGLCVMLVGTAIGLVPLLFHSRRMNCLGILLLPMACRMSGCGAVAAGWLGLI
jgi:putative membrane protein